MNNKTKAPSVTIGASSMLVIFIVLCIVIFSALSLATAINNKNYTEKIALRNTEYYSANNIAEEKKQEIYHSLYTAWKNSGKNNSFNIETALSEVKDIELQTIDKQQIIGYYIEVNDSQILQVQLELRDNFDTLDPNPVFFDVVSWKTLSTIDWQENNQVYVIGTKE